MKDTVIEVLKITHSVLIKTRTSRPIIDDLGGDEFDVVDAAVQIEEALDIRNRRRNI